MKLADSREAYSYFSGKASEVARALGLSGIAVVWVFRETAAGGASIPTGLYLPGVLFVAGLALDLLHYVYGAVAWGWYGRRHELRQVGEDDEFKAPRWVNWPTNALFTLKVGFIASGYVLLLKHLLTHLVSGLPPMTMAVTLPVTLELGSFREWVTVAGIIVTAVATAVLAWVALEQIRSRNAEAERQAGRLDAVAGYRGFRIRRSMRVVVKALDDALPYIEDDWAARGHPRLATVSGGLGRVEEDVAELARAAMERHGGTSESLNEILNTFYNAADAVNQLGDSDGKFLPPDQRKDLMARARKAALKCQLALEGAYKLPALPPQYQHPNPNLPPPAAAAEAVSEQRGERAS